MSAVQIGEHQVLYPSKLKWFLIVAICLPFAAAGFFPSENRGILAKNVPVFFSTMSLIALVQLFGKGSSLILDAGGFEERAFGQKIRFIRWDQCSDFSVAKYIYKSFVVFNQVQDQDKTTGKMNRGLAGDFSFLADTYGMKAEKLVELMNSYRQNAIETERG